MYEKNNGQAYGKTVSYSNYDYRGTPATYISGEATSPNILEYSIDHNRDAIVITGIRDKSITSLNIPERIEGKEVYLIESGAFECCKSLSTAVIPKTVVQISSGAFRDCPTLYRLTVLSPKINVCINALRGCTGLSGIDFPNLKSTDQITISAEAFDSARLPITGYKGGRYLSIGGNPYFALLGPESYSVPSCELHPSTVIIADDAFENCGSLGYLDLSSNVSIVPQGAFRGCRSLRKVNFGTNIRVISYGAFDNCTSLEEISLPSVTKLNGFEGCTSLRMIFAPMVENVFSTLPSAVSIEKCSFDPADLIYRTDDKYTFVAITGVKNRSVTMVTIPDKIDGLPVKVIDSGAFSGCYRLQLVILPAGVSHIDTGAFKGCSALKRISAASSELTILPYAFEGCSSLSDLELTSWESDAAFFFQKTAFEGTAFPITCYNGGKYLGMRGNPYFALIDAEDDKTVRCELHPNTEMIMGYAFYEHKKLEQLVLESKVTTISPCAFKNCKALSAVVFGGNVKFVRIDAFAGCTSLRRVDMPDVEVIEGFGGCYALQVLEAPAAKDITTDFSDSPKLAKVKLGTALHTLPKHAFASCKDLSSIDFEGPQICWKQCFSYKSISSAIMGASQIKKVVCTDGTYRLRWL